MLNKGVFDPRDYRVLCVGRMVLDVVARPIDGFPLDEGAEQIQRADLSYGGGAANTAVHLSNLGLTGYAAGILGDDFVGRILQHILQAHGVNTSKLSCRPNEASSFSLVLVNRSSVPRYLYRLGADCDVTRPQLVDELHLFEFMRREFITHLHVGGANLLPQLDGKPLEWFLRKAKKNVPGLTTSVDTSKVLPRARSNMIALPQIDIFFCNDLEGNAIAGTTNIEAILKVIAPGDGSLAKMCVIKMGEGGSVVCRAGEAPIYARGYDVSVENLNGAGDVYVARFLKDLLCTDKPIEELADYDLARAADVANNAAAGYISTEPGLPPKYETSAKQYGWKQPGDVRGRDRVAFLTQTHVKTFEQYRKLSPRVIEMWVAAARCLLPARSRGRNRILDVGCGTGRFAIPMAQGIEAIRVDAVDSSPEMLSVLLHKLRQSGVKNVYPRVVGFYQVSGRPVYDLLFFSEVIHLLRDFEQVFAKVMDLLKRRGTILIRMTSHAQLELQEWYRFFPGALCRDLRRHWDVPQIYRALADRGFTNIEIREVDETEDVPTDRYIGEHQQKSYSFHHLVDEKTFKKSIAMMKRELANQERVLRLRRMTLISAVRP